MKSFIDNKTEEFEKYFSTWIELEIYEQIKEFTIKSLEEQKQEYERDLERKSELLTEQRKYYEEVLKKRV